MGLPAMNFMKKEVIWMKLLNDFAIALVQPKRYNELLSNSVGRTALYIIILMLLSSVMLISGSIKLYDILGRYYAENVPEFTFDNGTLKSESTFDFDFSGFKLMIETDKQLSKDDFGKTAHGILFDSDSMITKSGKQVIEVPYTDLTQGESVHFTKDSLYAYKNIVKIIIVISAFFSLVFLAGGFMLSALIVAGIVSLFFSRSLLSGKKLSFGKVYQLSLYSRGLPMILSLICSMLFGNIPIIISLMISVLLMNIALSKIYQMNREL